MQDLIQEAIDAGIPVIDNTKPPEYYREQRLQEDLANLATHQFVQNVERGLCSIDPDTNAVRRRISFDLVYFQQQSSPFEPREALDEATKKRVAEQLDALVQCHS